MKLSGVNKNENKKKPAGKTLKRELAEWGIIVGIIGLLYITGLHTVVLGTLQSLVLKTGLIKPDTHTGNAFGTTDFNLSLVDANGRLLEGRDLSGKVVFLNFWATWCPPCIAEMPDINRLYNRLEKDDILFLMVSVDDDFEKAKRFTAKKGFSFNIYRPASGIPSVFTGNVVPTTYVISPDGTIVMKREGMAEYNTSAFREYLLSLRKKNG